MISNQLVSGSIPELLIKSSQYLLAFYFTQEGGYTVNIVDPIRDKLKEQKTGKQKQIKMTKTLKKEVREYIKDMPLHYYLFQSRIGKNKPLDRRTVDWILKTAAIECGIENIGTHSMRKTFGYHYYKKYKDVAMLMDLFNHSSPAITLRYIGIRQDQRDKAMSNFDL